MMKTFSQFALGFTTRGKKPSSFELSTAATLSSAALQTISSTKIGFDSSFPYKIISPFYGQSDSERRFRTRKITATPTYP